MSILSSENIEEITAKLQNFTYCFQIKLPEGKEIYLTSSDKLVKNGDISFLPNSGLLVKQAEFNDSAQNYVDIEGIFESGGIEYSMDLTGAAVKIILYTNNIFEHFITYYCSIYTKYDLNFKMHLKPEAVKYNQTIINSFSKNCRANFGDAKCSVDKSLYSAVYNVKEFFKKSFTIANLDKESGYYSGGEARLGDNLFNSKILDHLGDLIIVESIIPENVKATKNIRLTSGCDKKFITCCNKFNNAINFRGEPLIPNYNFINVNLNE
ncbi:DUF2163 domain-containing protein [Rickettsia endosymbiont of Polydrusus tereticollis]|uniref:DUF2163 domain-containing protein n=1 Tax=Rickettsia endosymbiont of Polydrusus tereticollis TaxID=3066251 RepID=UPI0031333B59